MFHALAKAPNADFDHEAAYMAVVSRLREAGAIAVEHHAWILLDDVYFGVRSSRPDFLGAIAAELGMLEKSWGQFFTPPEVSQSMASLMIDEAGARQEVSDKGYVTIYQPAAGGGAMLLAIADRLQEFGISPEREMFAEAWEMDPATARICFIQLSLREIPAVVIVGDTLSLEKEAMCWTRWIAKLAYHRPPAVAIAAE